MIDHPLYQSVLANPQSDEPRLVMADWLDERGNEQADLIRTQIGIARQDVVTPSTLRLLVRERTLLNRYLSDWNVPIHRAIRERTGLPAKSRGNPIQGFRFVRGFVGQIRIHAQSWIRWHTSLHEIMPLEELCLVGTARGFEEDRHPELLRGIQHLTVQAKYPVNAIELRQLLAREDVVALKTLSLYNVRITPQIADILVQNYVDAEIKIVLEFCQYDPDIVEPLARAFGDRIAFSSNPNVDSYVRTRREPDGTGTLSGLLRRWFVG